MRNIRVITDSACDLSTELVKKYGITVIPLNIHIGDETFVDRSVKNSEFYKKMSLSKELPKTSHPSTETFLENYEGDEDLIVITISSQLSSTYYTASLAQNMCEQNDKIRKIAVIDSEVGSIGQGQLAVIATKLIEEDKSFEEIVEELPKIRERVTGYFTISTLEYLKKGGRIGRLAGTVGEFLNLKPIITTDENGIYYNVAKVRGRKQSLSKMTEILKGYLEKGKCDVAVLHAGCEEEATKYMESIKSLPNVASIKIAEISPALGVHGGPGLMGFSVKMEK